MSLSILNNISSLEAQDSLTTTKSSLDKTLQALSTGQRINSGADDAAGLAIANGLEANITALSQSVMNATDGVGMLQVADGALSQVTSMLNRAITLATEAASGTVSTSQDAALDAEYQSILTEIGNIGTATTYNGQQILTGGSLTVYMSDSSTNGNASVVVNMQTLTTAALTLSGTDLTSAATAATALGDLNAAIAAVADWRGKLGASSNQLSDASNVMNAQITNLTGAESGIMDADIGKETADLSKYSILQQTGIAALQQSNSMQQNVLKLLQ
ncbi:MAG TPA: flagellin [Terriglobales bacterium]|nr:flagellin [Terriglobales bacterium]HXY14404.1 flagellin [Terriglobales bacterium]